LGGPLTGSLTPFILKNSLFIHFLFFILFYSFFWIKSGFFNIKGGREPVNATPQSLLGIKTQNKRAQIGIKYQILRRFVACGHPLSHFWYR
jgi:hypothetical protein